MTSGRERCPDMILIGMFVYICIEVSFKMCMSRRQNMVSIDPIEAERYATFNLIGNWKA